MVRTMRVVAGICLSLCLLTLLHPSQSQAIPAFARQNRTDCTTCHTIYPQLNELGEAFRKNSYVLPGKEEGRLPEKKEGASAKEYNAMEAVISAGIPPYVPLSVDGALNVVYNRHAADNNDTEIALRALRLHAGGNIRETVGYFATYKLFSQGSYIGVGNTPANNVPDIEEAFGIWRHVLGSPVNIKAGRMQPGISLWKSSNNLIETNYASHSYRAGTLRGRSAFSLDAPENAIELNSVLGSRAFVAAGVVDRKGQGADEGYGHFELKFGGTDFLGNEPDVDLKAAGNVWDYLHVTVGGFGYVGRNAKLDNNGIAAFSNNYYRAGGDLDAQYDRLSLRLTGTYGRDDNLGAFSTSAVAKADTDTYALGSELQYFFTDNIAGLVRYEQQDDGTALVHRYLPAVVYTPFPNFKVSLQYIYDDIRSKTESASSNQIGILSARLAF